MTNLIMFLIVVCFILALTCVVLFTLLMHKRQISIDYELSNRELNDLYQDYSELKTAFEDYRKEFIHSENTLNYEIGKNVSIVMKAKEGLILDENGEKVEEVSSEG